MRTIKTHIVNPANDKIVINVMDEPGDGGACHRYSVSGFSLKGNRACNAQRDGIPITGVEIIFQNGPINDFGVNGVTHEVLLAILIDRMSGFQAGKFACENNAQALRGLMHAQVSLQRRTLERMNRGVEGTHDL